jgi:hypothetical protein
LADIIGEEQIDWETFQVTDEAAPEFEQPVAETVKTESPEDEALAADDADTAQGERPRDPETGRFVAQEDDGPEPEPETPQIVVDPLVEQYLQRYGGDAEAALKAAAHQTALIGRQGSEIGELKAQLQGLVDLTRQGQQQPRFAQSIDVDNVIEREGLYAAAERTAQAQDWDSHNRVLRAWAEVDPDQAGVYQLSKQAQHEASLARQRAADAEQQQTQASKSSSAESAWARLAGEIPDLETLAPLMTEEAAEAYRISGGKVAYSEMIESGDPNTAYMALRTLALSARGKQVGNEEHRQQAAATIARTAAVESQRAKAEALVTSSDATAPDLPAPKLYDDELYDEFVAQDAPRADGWKIGNH